MRKSGRILLAAIVVFNGFNALAKKDGNEAKAFEFTTIHEIPTTTIKDQSQSSTCWSFSGLAMLEAEMLRLGKPDVDLSEMFVVWHTYSEKALKHVRLHGSLNFSVGGAFHDVVNMINKYGIVPEKAYTGLNYSEKIHSHGEMDKMIKEQVASVVSGKKLTTAWHEAIKGTLNSYLGELPETFTYEGKQYSPISFAKEYVGLNLNDYVEISSYTHHPFYTKFILEVPDNWSWNEVYNVPMEEMQQIVDYSLENGYTVAWAADISEKGFASSKKGVAVVPDVNYKDMSETEIAKWEELTEKAKQEKLFELNGPGTEKKITQEMRQVDFDNYQTTDDHGMLLVGTAKDQSGNVYYKVKNSWGKYNDYNGFFFASKPYMKYKTTCIMVHKDAIPKNIRKKLNL